MKEFTGFLFDKDGNKHSFEELKIPTIKAESLEEAIKFLTNANAFRFMITEIIRKD